MKLSSLGTSNNTSRAKLKDINKKCLNSFSVFFPALSAKLATIESNALLI